MIGKFGRGAPLPRVNPPTQPAQAPFPNLTQFGQGRVTPQSNSRLKLATALMRMSPWMMGGARRPGLQGMNPFDAIRDIQDPAWVAHVDAMRAKQKPPVA